VALFDTSWIGPNSAAALGANQMHTHKAENRKAPQDR
jgi:hypothetical protein